MRFVAVRLLVLLLFFSTLPAAFADETSHEVVAAAPTSTSTTAGLAVVHKVLGLTRQNFRLPVTTPSLVAGAFTGVHKYLVEHKLDARLAVPPTGAEANVALFDERWQAIIHQLPTVNGEALSEAAVRGMLATLDDPYTVYMDRQEYGGLMEAMDGSNFGGLGIYIEQDAKHDNRLVIIEPMEDSPAALAGIKAGDVITGIDGLTVAGMSLEDASKRLRGQEGAPITLTIERDGLAPFDVPMKRARLKTRTVQRKILNGNIGYARLRIFGENTGTELEEAFRDFDRAHVQGYILDLRNNGGGYINTALEVCSHFLPTGSRVVSVVERDNPEAIYSSLPNIRPALPLLILVNKYSASASEITAGALQDLHVGTLMGTRTFGKGSVQKIFPLTEGTAVKITTAHYHTPSGKDIHKVGIQPDVLTDMDPHDVGTSRDKQLTQAVSTLQATMAHETRPQDAVQHATPGPLGSIVPVREPGEEYEFLASHPCGRDGSSLIITDQKTVMLDGHYYDRVSTRCPVDGLEQVYLFDISPVLGRQ